MGPLKEPRQVRGLMDVFRCRYLLWLLVRKEVKVRYSGSPIGLAWSYVTADRPVPASITSSPT